MSYKMKFFKDDEFKCRCGCGADITDDAKKAFDCAREIAGVPFIVTSGARCKTHNKAVGGKDGSFHVPNNCGSETLSFAGDIAFTDSEQAYKILQGLIQAGFNGIGINFTKKFIHGDRRNKKTLFAY